MENELAIVMNKLYPGYQLKMPVYNIPVEKEVDYDDDQHKYYLGERVYRSATTIVSQFYIPFDTQAEAEKYAYRYGKTAEHWIAKWNRENLESLNRGNGIHTREEQFLYNRGISYVSRDPSGNSYRVYDPKAEVARLNSIAGLADGCYPELKLWRHDWGIAGRADKPTFETIHGVRFAHVEDYKTNKRIGKEHKYYPERKMLEPLTHLNDCEYNHYALQLSIYQYMLEYFGFKPGLRRLIHFPHPIEDLPGIPDPVIYELPYLREEVIMMLITLNQRGWLN